MLSSENNRGPWIPTFCGRGGDLDWLWALWERAKAGEPQIAVVLGDTGRGKTRLVQQFYTRLSTEEDPDHYWPDVLKLGKDPVLNPPPDSFQHRRPEDIPYVWWAIRFKDPSERNPLDANPLLSQKSKLSVHLAFVAERRRLAKRYRSLAIQAGEVVAEGLPLVGSVAAALKVVKLGGEAVELRKRKRQTEQDTVDERQRDAIQRESFEIVDLLSSAFSEHISDAPTVPVVIVLDDAQWIDPFSVATIAKVLGRDSTEKEGGRTSRPILVIATHWLREWNEHQEGLTGNDELGSLADLASFAESEFAIPVSQRHLEPLREDPEADKSLQADIADAMPGLTKAQTSQLIEGAGGNLQLLVECVRALLDQREHVFREGDASKGLTNRGRRLLRDIVSETSVYDLVKRRFSRLGDIADTLSAGSLQGELFLPFLLREIAKEVLPDDEDPSSAIEVALRRGENPFALIDYEPRQARFVETLYFRVANDRLKKDPVWRRQLADAVRDVLIRWIETARWERMRPDERSNFLWLAESSLYPLVEGQPDGR